MTNVVAGTISIKGDVEAFGYILDMIMPTDDVPLWEQIHNGYAHGGGWHDFDGFSVIDEGDERKLRYPGDPDFKELARITVNDDEELSIFDYSWVLWRKKGHADKIARID